MKTRITSLITLCITLSVNFTSWSQCAMCRAVLESEGSNATAEGINNGIIYLMVIPYILVAFVGYQIFKKRKK